MSDQDFSARLTALQERLAEARARLARSDGLNAGHQATASELMSRYAVIETQVAQDEATEASHGDSVSDLEHALRMWVKQLDLDLV